MNMSCVMKENMVGFYDYGKTIIKNIFVFRLNVSLEQKLHPPIKA